MASRVPELLRTFVALVPSEATASALAAEGERIARADRAARPVPSRNVHLTLAFLGPTPAQAVPRITEALVRAVAGVGPVRLRPVGLATFPGRRAPRVVFASLAPEAHPALEMLAGRVSEALSAAGHGPDPADRFHAHITLARLQPPSPSPALKKLLTAGTLQSTYIDDVITDLRLVSSEPAPSEPASAPVPPSGNACGIPRSADVRDGSGDFETGGPEQSPEKGPEKRRGGPVYRTLASVPLRGSDDSCSAGSSAGRS